MNLLQYLKKMSRAQPTFGSASDNNR